MNFASSVAKLHPVHLRRTFALQAFGNYDPSANWNAETLTKSFFTPAGVCTVIISRADDGLMFEAEGEEAKAAVSQLAVAAEIDDGYANFAPEHQALASHHRQFPGLRLIRVPWLFDIACSAVLQQRVGSTDAMREWGSICSRFGQKAPNGQTAFLHQLPCPQCCCMNSNRSA